MWSFLLLFVAGLKLLVIPHLVSIVKLGFDVFRLFNSTFIIWAIQYLSYSFGFLFTRRASLFLIIDLEHLVECMAFAPFDFNKLSKDHLGPREPIYIYIRDGKKH